MASESEASCDADPNFAVICAFLEKFGTACGLRTVDFIDLQEMLENTQEVSPILKDLHIKLMRKMRKSINTERWERGIVKICHTYSNQDAWEIERFGYKKARLSAKLRLLKELLEMQFDNNTSFKNKINVITAKELRSQPIGKDKLGNAYWYQADVNCQIRVYKEDPDEETWALVAKDREGLVSLISKLSDNHDSSSTDAVTNEDSNSLEDNKPILDTGQQDSNSSKKSSSDDDKLPPVLTQEVDDEDTKMDSRSMHVQPLLELAVPLAEEKKPELSGIKEKYIRSDNFIQSNRKAVESAGFVDIENADLKRPCLDEDIEEPSLIKRPRTDRPTLLGNKKKPYLQKQLDEELEEEEEEVDEEEDSAEEEEQVDEEEDEEDEDDEDDDDDDDEGDDESEVGDEIEEPLMLVTGKGNGEDNKCGNPIVGEAIEEAVVYFYGEGSGRDCDTGNDGEKKEDAKSEASHQKDAETDSSIMSPTKNNFKLGTIIDSKTDHLKDGKLPPKKSPSRWDIGKPEQQVDVEGKTGGAVKKLVNKFENISKDDGPAPKKPMFFFGPGSGFSFKAPTPIVTSVSMSFGGAAMPNSTGAPVEATENDKDTPEDIVLSKVDDCKVNAVETSQDETNDNDQIVLDTHVQRIDTENNGKDESTHKAEPNENINENKMGESTSAIEPHSDEIGEVVEKDSTHINTNEKEEEHEQEKPQLEISHLENEQDKQKREEEVVEDTPTDELQTSVVEECPEEDKELDTQSESVELVQKSPNKNEEQPIHELTNCDKAIETDSNDVTTVTVDTETHVAHKEEESQETTIVESEEEPAKTSQDETPAITKLEVLENSIDEASKNEESSDHKEPDAKIEEVIEAPISEEHAKEEISSDPKEVDTKIEEGYEAPLQIEEPIQAEVSSDHKEVNTNIEGYEAPLHIAEPVQAEVSCDIEKVDSKIEGEDEASNKKEPAAEEISCDHKEPDAKIEEKEKQVQECSMIVQGDTMTDTIEKCEPDNIILPEPQDRVEDVSKSGDIDSEKVINVTEDSRKPEKEVENVTCDGIEEENVDTKADDQIKINETIDENIGDVQKENEDICAEQLVTEKLPVEDVEIAPENVDFAPKNVEIAPEIETIDIDEPTTHSASQELSTTDKLDTDDKPKEQKQQEEAVAIEMKSDEPISPADSNEIGEYTPESHITIKVAPEEIPAAVTDEPICSVPVLANKVEDESICLAPVQENKVEDASICSAPVQENKVDDESISSVPVLANKVEDESICSAPVQEKKFEDESVCSVPVEIYQVEDESSNSEDAADDNVDLMTPLQLTGMRDTISECMEIEEMQEAPTYCFTKLVTEVPEETHVRDNKKLTDSFLVAPTTSINESVSKEIARIVQEPEQDVYIHPQNEQHNDLPTDLSQKVPVPKVMERLKENIQEDLLDLSKKPKEKVNDTATVSADVPIIVEQQVASASNNAPIVKAALEATLQRSAFLGDDTKADTPLPLELSHHKLVSAPLASESNKPEVCVAQEVPLELTKSIIVSEQPKVRAAVVDYQARKIAEIFPSVVSKNIDAPVEFAEVPIAKVQVPMLPVDNEMVSKNTVSDLIDLSEEHLIIQEIGSISNLDPNKNPKLISAEAEAIEKQIGNMHQDSQSPDLFEMQVVKPPKEIVEIPCEKKHVSLLMDDNDDQYSDDMNYDDDNISEPMELEESKNSEIIEHSEPETKEPPVAPTVVEEPKIPEKKVSSLQSLSLDFTGEAPDLSEVHALVKRARKRGPDEEADSDAVEETTGGKRRKVRGRRTVDKELRRSIEEAKNQEVSSSDEERKKPKADELVVKSEKKPKSKRRRTILGLDIPEDGGLADAPTGLRQSRRIAQIKIKEEAERRKMEEIALDEMKNTQKRKSKKDEDKDYKAEKRKKVTSDESSNDAAEVEDTTMEKKKKKKRRHRKFDESNPWRSSSDSSSEDSHVEEEEEEEETYIETIKSDHEFSPESDLENTQDPQPLKRARTVRKEDEEQEVGDNTNCQKCHKSDHPEWILLCDGCDSGWHCSCLRPALLVIPEGDWYCPPCQHTGLIKLLQEKLVEFDKVQTKKEVEIRRKERLAYVGISLDNVLPAKEDTEAQKIRRERTKQNNVKVSGDESASVGSDSKSESESGSSSESSSSSSDSDDEPIYKLRQRRQAHSYRFKDYDELINSAIQDEVEVKQQSVDYQSKGKDMSTIAQAEGIEQKQEQPVAAAEDEESEEEIIKPVKKVLGKKKHRRLNSLDISSEEDADSDEDFKGSSGDEDDDYEDYNDSGSSSDSYVGRRKKGKGAVRRSTRARINRYDRDFINDDSEDSDDPKGKKRSRSDWDESEESEEDSDGSWGRKKKRGAKERKPPVVSSSKSKSKKSKKKKNQDDSDAEVYRRKKPKKFGPFDEDDDGRRRTRGKKINYLDALGTDSEEEGRRRNQVKDEESEDEFVLNEEEDDVQDEEGREVDDSDDSNIGGLVPAVKKGSKKGKGKGGIKRIKRAQGEEEEALFPPLPYAPAAKAVALSDVEPNPIEQINKDLEAMDEKEIGMMMEEEEYANKQLQMVAAQLEKEKRRKEMEARKLEMALQPAPVPAVQEVINPVVIPSVIQAIPAAMPPQVMPQVSPHLHPMHMEQLQPIHHDHPPPAMLQSLPPMTSPQHLLQQSPQHLLHLPLAGEPQPLMLVDTSTPKKRGRKPKSQLTSPEMPVLPPAQPPFIPTPPSSEKADDSDISYNADGTPKKRRGRGKGKKTLEKEAAAKAAATDHVSPSNSSRSPSAPKEPERIHLPVEVKTTVPPDIPMVGGKLGVASAPQPFSQSQPKPSVITRMLQTQTGQPAYPVGSVSHVFGPEPLPRPPLPRPQLGPPFIPAVIGPGGVPVPPPRGLHPGAFRPAANHYPVIRSGAPPIRPQNMPPHLYHHPMDTPPGGPPPIAERSSPALPSPSSASALTTKSDQAPPPPPPPYTVRSPMVRFPPTIVAPGMPPRHPQLLPQMHPSRPPYPGVPPHNFHYAPPYGEGGSQFQQVPPQYQEPFAGDPDAPKNYDEEENGEFGGLVSYFSSQREDDLDT